MISLTNNVDFATRVARSADVFAKANERVASGLRINDAGDDAGGLAMSEDLRTTARGLAQAAANIQDAIHIVKIGEDGLQLTIDALQRMRELVVQAANGTNTAGSLEAIQTELDETRKLCVSSFGVAFTFRHLIDGNPFDRKLDFQVGADNSAADRVRVDYTDLRTSLIELVIGIYGYEELVNSPETSTIAISAFGNPLPDPTDFVPPFPPFPPVPPGTTFAQAFPKLLTVDPNTPSNIQNAFSVLDTGMERLIEHTAYLGAAHNRLEHSLAQVMNEHQQQVQAESRIRDADMANEAVNLTRGQVLTQTSLTVVRESTQRGSSILALLREVPAGGNSGPPPAAPPPIAGAEL